MGFMDALLGRRKQPKPDLDQLFAVPSAAVTLQVSGGFTPTGVGSVCYRANEGAAFATMEGEVQRLLDADGGPAVERVTDSFGFTWLVCRQQPDAVSDLVTELHAVNRALEEAGFGTSLLCSLVAFEHTDGRRLGLVYLYKQGTFYPFAPVGGGQERRDNSLELQVRGLLSNDLIVESDLSRWMAIWGAPGV
ncbi:MAG: PspA-associated protein PspAB [Nocardioidaceae bacterium]